MVVVMVASGDGVRWAWSGAVFLRVHTLPHTLSVILQKLYFCEYDLAFFRTRDQLLRHLRKCDVKHPPGDEIYRRGDEWGSRCRAR